MDNNIDYDRVIYSIPSFLKPRYESYDKRLSESQRASLLVYKAGYTLLCTNLINEEFASELGKLTLSKDKNILDIYELGLNIYDIHNEDMEFGNAAKRLYRELEYFSKIHSELDLYKSIRYFMATSYSLGSMAITFIIQLYYVITEFYGTMDIVGIEDNKIVRKSCIDGYGMSSLDVQLLMFCTFKGVTTNTKFTLAERKKEVVVKIYKDAFGRGLLNKIDILDKQSRVRIASNMGASQHVIYFTGIYNNKPYANNNLDYSIFDREDMDSTSSTLCRLVMSLINDYNYKVNPLLKRKFYLKDKGITLHFKNTVDKLSHINIREVHQFNGKEMHYLYATLHYEELDITRDIVLNLDNLGDNTTLLMYEIDFTALLLIYSWLGIAEYMLESMIKTPAVLLKRKFDSTEEFSEDDKKELIISTKSVFNEMAKYTTEDNIVYEVPYSWNYKYEYKNNKKKDIVKNDTLIIEKSIVVGRYTRKLPVGQVASENAKELAKKYRIDLDDGKTLVDDFDRTVKIKVK